MNEDSNMSEPNRLLIDESVSSSAPASPRCRPNNSATTGATEEKMAAAVSNANKTARKSNRITEFIEDKSSRIKSYFRRRHVPLKRAFDMDLQCGTQTFMVQMSDDIEECLYYGHDKLVQRFLSSEGLTIADVNSFISEEKMRFGQFVDEDPDLLESLGKKRRKSTVKSSLYDEDDDDFSPTVKEKERKNREKRREAAKRVQEGDYLSNINERTKVFRSRKDTLIGKIGDTDSVCGTKTFLVIINMDQEAAWYHGDPVLVSQFFTKGVSNKSLPDSFNVRPFEVEELEFTSCSVPHCLVTRNTLSRWRQAAIRMFKFPKDLPMTLHQCPEADREKWLAELDLDPNKTNSLSSKLAICSLHFREGFPTDQYPLPTELLSDKNDVKNVFKGKNDNDLGQVSEASPDSEEDEEVRFTQFVSKGSKKSVQAKLRSAILAKRKRRQWIPSADYSDKKSVAVRRRKLAHSSLFGSRLLCRFCSTKHVGTKQYLRHVRHFHLPSISSRQAASENEVIPPPQPAKKVKLPPVSVSDQEKAQIATLLYPKGRAAKPMNPKKKYVCAVCKSTCDLYGLFIHMKTVHQGLMCCYCLKLFKKVSDLEIHIKKEHRVPKRYYHNTRQFVNLSGQRYNFVCSVCSEIITLKDLDKHGCKLVTKKSLECHFCDRVFAQQSQLDVHLSNGWCREMPKMDDLDYRRKVYKVLTGKDALDPAIFEAKSEQQQPSKEKKKVVNLTAKKPKFFNVHDRRVLEEVKKKVNSDSAKTESVNDVTINDLPSTGSLFYGLKSRGLSATLKKEIRENGSIFVASPQEKLDTEPAIGSLQILRYGDNFCIMVKGGGGQGVSPVKPDLSLPLSDSSPQRSSLSQQTSSARKPNRRFGPKIPLNFSVENKENNHGDSDMSSEKSLSSLKISIPMIKREGKAERLARAAKEIPANFDKLGLLLTHLAKSCLFCQQAHHLNVDSLFLLSHLLILHDRQLINGYLGEDAQDSISRIKTYIRDAKVKEVIFNHEKKAEEAKETHFQCSSCVQDFSHLDQLMTHVQVEHQTKVLTCHLCQHVFLNYGSFAGHVCAGPGTNVSKFKCQVCKFEDLNNFMDFQRHVRQSHHLCDVCLHECEDKEDLFRHCHSNHEQEVMCMKCLMQYENHQQFRKHLYYKHDQEHQECPTCHQKTWSHVYHFCIESQTNTCEVCEANFDSFKKYRVHLRTHTGATPHLCSVRGCKKSYVSKQLLLKHYIRRHPDMRPTASAQLEARRNKKYLEKMGATSLETIRDCQDIVQELINQVIPYPPEADEVIEDKKEESKEPSEAENETEEVKEPNEKQEEEAEEEEFDPIASAVASIMGPDGAFDIRKSPVKPVTPQHTPSVPKPIAMPPLIPINNDKVKSGESLLKPSVKPVDPLKEMLQSKSQHTLPPPSNILPPSTFNEIINGPKKEEKEEEEDKKEDINPVLGGIWNQDLMFVSNATENNEMKREEPPPNEAPKASKGCKVMKPRYQIEDSKRKGGVLTNVALQQQSKPAAPKPSGEWEVLLSESSGSDNEDNGPRKARIKEKSVCDKRVALREHDYCYAAFLMSKEEEKPKEDLSEMDKILSNVALGAFDASFEMNNSAAAAAVQKAGGKKHKKSKKENKKKKKKRKKHKKSQQDSSGSSSDSEAAEVDVTSTETKRNKRKWSSKAKYHIQGTTNEGFTASAARPHFSSSDGEDDDLTSGGELASSDLDTDFSADEGVKDKRKYKPTPKAMAFAEDNRVSKYEETDDDEGDEDDEPETPSLKLKIKLPTTPQVNFRPQWDQANSSSLPAKAKKKAQKRKKGAKNDHRRSLPTGSSVVPKKMRNMFNYSGVAASKARPSSESSDYDSDFPSSQNKSHYAYVNGQASSKLPPLVLPNVASGTMPGISSATASSGVVTDDKLYCVCQSPHDDVSEMIGCDAPDCRIEWFHFECVGIMVPPEGQWYCPECTRRYNIRADY